MSSEPRNVLAPPNALAWIEGDENYAGRWAYHSTDIDDARQR